MISTQKTTCALAHAPGHNYLLEGKYEQKW